MNQARGMINSELIRGRMADRGWTPGPLSKDFGCRISSAVKGEGEGVIACALVLASWV